MRKDILRMSRREIDRLMILEGVIKGEVTQVIAGEVLGLSERQVRRLVWYSPNKVDMQLSLGFIIVLQGSLVIQR